MNTCKFCNKFNNGYLVDHNYDTILFESTNFVVTPTMGSLVENWLLITSKEHFICAGELNESYLNELDGIISLLKDKLSVVKKKIFVFEHGPCSPLQTTGCGIDHLHLHIVPLDFDLVEAAKEQYYFKWQLLEQDLRSSFLEKQQSYLYIESSNGEKYISTNDEIPSQFFRRVIATKLGISEKFDWNLNFGNENIKKTLSSFFIEFEIA